MRKGLYSILFVLILAVSVAAQVKPAPSVDVIPDVVYGHKDGMALTFDVFKPKTQPNGAVIIFIVSGGWISTYIPTDLAVPRYQELLGAGFTVITLRHGGSPKYLIPEIVADVRRGVRFIRYHARDWGIDPNRIGVYGGSAGGHLALMIGLASDNGDATAKEDFMKVSDRVAAVVAYFPPVDLRQITRGLNPPPSGTVLDRFPAMNFEKEKAADYSPIVFVTPDDPPTLLIHGDQDDLVNISNSQIIFEAFKKNNVKTDFITIPGAGHGFKGEDAKRAMAATVSWFETTLVKNVNRP
jgi:acetyl esterase/lipase